MEAKVLKNSYGHSHDQEQIDAYGARRYKDLLLTKEKWVTAAQQELN